MVGVTSEEGPRGKSRGDLRDTEPTNQSLSLLWV